MKQLISDDTLGLGHSLGRLASGYRADIVAFRPEGLEVLATWVAGNPYDASTGCFDT